MHKVCNFVETMVIPLEEQFMGLDEVYSNLRPEFS